MMRSMFAAVSGLRNHQTMMDVIASNISNVNSFGFGRAAVAWTDEPRPSSTKNVAGNGVSLAAADSAPVDEQ